MGRGSSKAGRSSGGGTNSPDPLTFEFGSRFEVDDFFNGQPDMASKLKEMMMRNVDFKTPDKLSKTLGEQEIIDKIGGPDLTDGSCASLALTYVANRAGFDVLDYRGGVSRSVIAQGVTRHPGWYFGKDVKYETVRDNKETASAMRLLSRMQPGKEYILSTGRHAAIVRKKKSAEEGYEFLELQGTKSMNGFHDLDSSVLHSRFKTAGRSKYKHTSSITDIESLGKDEGFKRILGYINTDESKQKKGAGGYAK